jgi:hypothetical protein
MIKILVLTFENFKNTKYNNHALNLGYYLGCIVWGCKKGDRTQLAKKGAIWVLQQ